MPIIKFTMSTGVSFSLPIEQAEKVINSIGQLVKIYDANNRWTGKTINKAHIVSTSVDYEAQENEIRLDIPALPEPGQELESERVKRNRIKINQIRTMLHGKFLWNKKPGE